MSGKASALGNGPLEFSLKLIVECLVIVSLTRMPTPSKSALVSAIELSGDPDCGPERAEHHHKLAAGSIRQLRAILVHVAQENENLRKMLETLQLENAEGADACAVQRSASLSCLTAG